jgi:hypothetical protein
MVSIGGVATEDSADPELIVSFGVCLVCPLRAEVFDKFLVKSWCRAASGHPR